MDRNWDIRNSRDDRDDRDDRHNRRWENNQDRDRFDNRGRDYDRNRHEELPQAPADSYRGAYRLDNSSDHKDVSTYYGFSGLDNDNERRGAYDDRQMNRRGANRDNYFENQNRNNRNQSRDNRYDTDDYRQEWDDRMRGRRDNVVHNDSWGGSNFHNDYGPDHYPHYRGENTGNMAGSLSYGYDGDRVSDPDSDRRYNPYTGNIRHEQEIRQRRHQGQNPSSYRLHNLNDDRGHY